jgi:ketosteroid isomerase-like protein
MAGTEGLVTDSVISTVRRVYEAYGAKDRGAIEAIIDDDFHFTSPLDNRIDRQTYFDRCWKASETIAGFRFINLVGDGDRVFVTDEGRRASGEAFRNTEILTVRDGKIVEAEVYFGWSIPHAAAAGGFIDP